jgi:hypothetical protein
VVYATVCELTFNLLDKALMIKKILWMIEKILIRYYSSIICNVCKNAVVYILLCSRVYMHPAYKGSGKIESQGIKVN